MITLQLFLEFSADRPVQLRRRLRGDAASSGAACCPEQLAERTGICRSCDHCGNDARPIAVNAATFVGTKLAGLPGVLLLVNAFWDGGPVTLAETNWTMLLLFAGCLLLLRKTKLSPILIMVRAGVINVVKAVLAG